MVRPKPVATTRCGESKAMKLDAMPPLVLRKIISESLSLDSSRAQCFLASLGTKMSEATYSALLFKIIINDIDSLGFLTHLLNEKPFLLSRVEHAVVTSPRSGREEEDDYLASTNGIDVVNIAIQSEIKTSSASGEKLLASLSQLASFTWISNQLPPNHLITLLPASLTSFRFNPSPSTTVSSSNDENHSAQVGTLLDQLKWDAFHLSSLSSSLINLSISYLSVEGVKRLSIALESNFLALERLELSNTRYIDDHVMLAAAEGCKKLKVLKIREMAGTKLTDAGLIKIFENESIEELVLDQVEGRLSKTFWKKLSPLPESFKSIAISFAEGHHHSWIADHLESFAVVCAAPTIESISVIRRVNESFAEHSISDLPTPKPLPAKMLSALVERRDAKLRTIEVDHYEINLDNLKSIMEKNVGLVSLRVLLNEPFKSILTLASSFALTIHLRSLIVSISSRQHSVQVFALSSSRSIDLASSSPKTRSTLPSAVDGDSLPPLRDWRRLLKKSQRLEQIVCRGVGRYIVSRGGAGSSVKVEFEPIGATHHEAEEGEDDDDVEDGASTVASPHGPSSPRRSRSTRRASSVSLTGSISNFEFSSATDSPATSASDYSGLGIDTLSASPGSNMSSPTSPVMISRKRSSVHNASITAGNPMSGKRVAPTATNGIAIPLTASQKSALLLEKEKERLERDHLEGFPRLSPAVVLAPQFSPDLKRSQQFVVTDKNGNRSGAGSGHERKKSTSGVGNGPNSGDNTRRGSSGGMTSSGESGVKARRNSAIGSSDTKNGRK